MASIVQAALRHGTAHGYVVVRNALGCRVELEIRSVRRQKDDDFRLYNYIGEIRPLEKCAPAGRREATSGTLSDEEANGK